MAYESIDRLKKYMQKKIDAIVTGEKVTFNINAHQLLDEINEMEHKAKAWDEILNITQLQHEEEYVEDVISVIDKYKEDE